MNIDIKGKKYTLGDPFNDGGEGEVYMINYDGENRCVKIYHPDKRTAFVERKVLTLINKFQMMDLGVIGQQIAYPELPVYESGSNKFCGFLMKYFQTPKRLIEFTYSKVDEKFGESQLSEKDAIQIVDDLFYKLKILHRVGLVIGDLNPENILIDPDNYSSFLVDVDSFQIGSYYSNSRRKDYFDPSVKIDGYGKAKYFIYSIHSDIYSMSTIAYEFLVGSNPHYFSTLTPSDTYFKKQKDLSLLDYFVGNKNKAYADEILFKDEMYYLHIARLNYLKENSFDFFLFLKAIFSEGKRYYYGKERKEIKIQKRKGLLTLKESELIPQEKEDPEVLELFLNQYQLHLP